MVASEHRLFLMWWRGFKISGWCGWWCKCVIESGIVVLNVGVR